MKNILLATAALAVSFGGAAFAHDHHAHDANPEAAYPHNHTSVTREIYVAPSYGEPASPSEIRGYKVKGDRQAWETERMGKSGSDGSVDAFQRTGPGRVKAFRAGPDTNR